MRRLKRNQREFEYCLYTGMEETLDSKGYKTGHNTPTYAEAVKAKGNVIFTGTSSVKPYGVDENFSVCIIPDKPLDVTTETKILIDGKEYFVKSHPTTMNEQRIYCR